MRFFVDRCALLGVGLLFGSGQLAPACLWDGDTLRDELKTALSDFDLITGQIPHHGDEYYRSRVALLSKGEKTKDTRNDLAVAHIRLGEFAKAEALLLENLENTPGDYFTISNLGVLEKKRGNYEKASDYIDKALAIRPEGHLGLGDWYLKMLHYRAARTASPKKIPANNFLGQDYKVWFHEGASTGDGVRALTAKEQAYHEKLRRLLQNDQTFADGFVAMGEFQARRGHLHLAFLCFTRALELEHPNDSQMRRRRREILSEWQSASNTRIPNRNKYWQVEIAKAEAHLKNARSWGKRFHIVEAQIVQREKKLPSFDETLARMEAMKIAKYRPGK